VSRSGERGAAVPPAERVISPSPDETGRALAELDAALTTLAGYATARQK
jgi:hypothetical protein